MEEGRRKPEMRNYAEEMCSSAGHYPTEALPERMKDSPKDSEVDPSHYNLSKPHGPQPNTLSDGDAEAERLEAENQNGGTDARGEVATHEDPEHPGMLKATAQYSSEKVGSSPIDAETMHEKHHGHEGHQHDHQVAHPRSRTMRNFV